MATYLIGDVHGCYDELIALLQQVEFTPDTDTLWLTGDLVARGPGSLDVLRYVKSLGNSVRLVLGNHDLHLLAVFAGISRNKPKDRLTPLLEAPDADELLNWLRRQPLLQVDEEKKLVMAHAGITPQWDLQTAKECARDVEAVLSSDSYPFFLDAMYGDMPNNWSPELSGLARLRFITNAFTRMRYCFPNGQLDMYSKASPENAPAPLKPWFAIPGPVSEAYSIAFGHWASLEGKGTPEGIYALDTGCCWGGELTCLRWEDKQYLCSRQTARWIWAKAKRSTPDRFMPDGATLIRPTSGSRVGRIRHFAAIRHYSVNDAPESRNNSCENSARRHRETH